MASMSSTIISQWVWKYMDSRYPYKVVLTMVLSYLIAWHPNPTRQLACISYCYKKHSSVGNRYDRLNVN